ncbi:Acetyltransferase (GNAT) family protein [Corynebacterium glaucum]|uniref:Acetyltransferase (GNAT) family protein n=1 Tax=Corynebacterium glaucum TaxID=187491 RepID=A0A1Q2HX45_9CORY|nr:GNAT family N-acetyltransferase [Corynebacterium glaucum]AQQ15436.1 Acetyltransferase (GNAT) family protein [Corynebacterium glaucum]WJZ07936.1 Acetyltransferase (GNAT) family protein [Corynebacterium glaucum]
MLTALQYVPRPGATPDNPDAAVGAYAFSATLAIQDITGLATSGITTAHVAKRLENSTESRAYLFALTSRTAPRPVTELGFPELTDDDLLDIDAWVFISLPLLEDLQVIEANVTLDASIAPLPGEEVPRAPWFGAFSLIDALSNALSRPIRHLWVTHPEGEFTPPGAVEAGYAPAFREDQAVFEAAAVETLAGGSGDGLSIQVVEGPGFAGFTAGVGSASADAEQFAALLTAASRDYPRGELALEPIVWDLQRITDAGARLQDRGGNQLTGICRASLPGQNDRIVGICEAVHYTSDSDAVCELGLIYVLPEFRGRGIGEALIRETVSAARKIWEDLETVYCSYPAGSAPAESIMRALNAAVVSSTTAWQRC